IRLAKSMLKHEFAKEQTVGLAAAQRQVIRAKADPTRVRPIFRWAAVAGSVAAGLFVVASLTVPSLLRPRQAAVATTPVFAPLEERAAGIEADREVKKEIAVANRRKLDANAQETELREQQLLQGQQGQQGQQFPQAAAAPPPVALGLLQRQEGGRFAMKSIVAGDAKDGLAGAGVLADRAGRPQFNTESYDLISDNPFIRVAQDPL